MKINSEFMSTAQANTPKGMGLKVKESTGSGNF